MDKKWVLSKFFVRKNNMFMGKIEEWQLDYIAVKLSELHNEGWRCLLRCHSLQHLKRALEIVRLKYTSTTSSFFISNPEEDFKCLRSSIRSEDKLQVEAYVDCVLFSEILTRKPKLPNEVVLETETEEIAYTGNSKKIRCFRSGNTKIASIP